MSLYTQLVSHVIFPLHECLKNHDTVSIRKQMEKTEWLSKSELQSLQLEKLKSFLSDVENHVPYYQQLFKQLNFNSKQITSLLDLQQLPFTTKAVIRENLEQITADNAQNLAKFNTGGSTGEPLIFYIGKKRVSHDVAAKWRATRWWNVDIGDPEAVIWGSPIELGTQDLIKIVRDKLIRTYLIPAFEMSTANVEGFIQQIKVLKPKMLFGYPSALAHIATHADKTGQQVGDLGIKVAFVTSERLYDHQREKIEQVFCCPVANGYGGRDAGFIAHQCPSGGMHITAEDIIVEIIDSNGQTVPEGESGEIVITHLATRDFPFIRYKTGDVGKLSESDCQCGRGLPLLKEIQGRTTDFIIAKNGTVLHGLALIYVLRGVEGIESFKIIQQSIDETKVQVVKNQNYNEQSEEKIIQEFKQRLGQEVEILVEYKTEIGKEKSGKFRYVVSHVALNRINNRTQGYK